MDGTARQKKIRIERLFGQMRLEKCAEDIAVASMLSKITKTKMDFKIR